MNEPKYFRDDLVVLVKEEFYKLSNGLEIAFEDNISFDLSIDFYSKFYSVDEELLDEILNTVVVFKKKHYEVVSKITGLTIEELLADKRTKYRIVYELNNNKQEHKYFEGYLENFVPNNESSCVFENDKGDLLLVRYWDIVQMYPLND